MNNIKKRNSSLIADLLSIALFAFFVVIGTLFINNFIFRSFSVEGPSMETTMYTGDRLIVNRIPVTMSQLDNEEYAPERYDVVVFSNPQPVPSGSPEEYIVKRVIGLPGERVVVRDGEITVFNDENPDGFNPDLGRDVESVGSPASGDADTVVPKSHIFVVGDHRQDNYSYDSRNGLGTIPLYEVIGPVAVRFWPLSKFALY